MSVIKDEDFVDVLLEEVGWYRSNDGKYFSYFTTRKEAAEWLADQARKYKYAPKVNLTWVVKHAKENGIKVYQKHLKRWFVDILGIRFKRCRIRKKIVAPEDLKQRTSITISPTLKEALNPLAEEKMKSWWIEMIVRANIGMEIDVVVVWMDGGAVMFWEEGMEIRSLHMHWLSQSTKQVVRSWCDMADDGDGLREIAYNAEVHGFRYRAPDFDNE